MMEWQPIETTPFDGNFDGKKKPLGMKIMYLFV